MSSGEGIVELLRGGLALQRAGRADEAAERYLRVLDSQPRNFDALQLLGVLRFRDGRVIEGLKLLERAIELQPSHGPTLNNLGNALRAAGRIDDALRAYRRAVNVLPNAPAVLMRNLGSLLVETGSLEEGARWLGAALAADPLDPEIHCWAGHLNVDRGQPTIAIAAYRAALRLNPNLAAAHRGLGLAYVLQREHGAALASLADALALDPSDLMVRTLHLAEALQLAEWEAWPDAIRAIEASAASAGPPPPVDGFRLLYAVDSLATQRRFADSYARFWRERGEAPAPNADRPASLSARTRIRVAYLSGDIREHPVAQSLAGVVEHHDRSKFEIYVYALGPASVAGVGRRIITSCDVARVLESPSDAELLAQLRADGPDLLIDLIGYTDGRRPRVLAARPARLQVGWLGYAGTLGDGLLDYIIADAFVVPPGSEQGYAERIVRLPDTFFPSDRSRSIAEPRARDRYGLPESAVVLASLGQVMKLNPILFTIWLDILREQTDAVLWLACATVEARENLRRAARSDGVDPERIVFAERLPSLADHLARYRVADLALDTFPYGSHTTAVDALWAGCPLVALAGEAFASRVSGSILRAACFPELVATSIEDYRALVSDLVRDRGRRMTLRARLEAGRERCALFDPARFTAALEQAYAEMHARARTGAAAADIWVRPDATD